MVMLFGVVSLLDLLGIGLIGPFMASLEPGAARGNAAWGGVQALFVAAGFSHPAVGMGLVILVAFYLKGVSAYWIRKRIVAFSMSHLSWLRGRLMGAFQSMPYHDYLTRNTAEMVQSISNYTVSYTNGVLVNSLSMTAEAISVLFVIGLLFSVSPVGVLGVLGMFVVVIALYYAWVRSHIVVAGRECNVHSKEIIRGVNEGMGGFKEVRVLGCERYFFDQVREASDGYGLWNERYQGYQIIPRYLVESAMVTFVVGVVLVSEAAGVGLTEVLPVLGMFGVAGVRLMPAASQMISGVNQMRFSRHAMQEVYRDLREVERMGRWTVPEALPEGSGPPFERFTLKGVDYTYPGADRPALSGISIDLQRGRSIGIIGRSGAGKTTLIDLILGFLPPQRGEMLVNGEPLGDNPRRWLTRVAYIPQTIFLADDTLRQNVALGVPAAEIDGQRVDWALRLAQLEEVVAQLAEGVETRVGENGIRLSGGQRQRVALARALYHQREVIIMDEATSALDHETERAITAAVDALRGERTFIIIAHRLSTLADCDVVYRLHEGRIVEEGSYAEVVGER